MPSVSLCVCVCVCMCVCVYVYDIVYVCILSPSTGTFPFLSFMSLTCYYYFSLFAGLDGLVFDATSAYSCAWCWWWSWWFSNRPWKRGENKGGRQPLYFFYIAYRVSEIPDCSKLMLKISGGALLRCSWNLHYTAFPPFHMILLSLYTLIICNMYYTGMILIHLILCMVCACVYVCMYVCMYVSTWLYFLCVAKEKQI